MLYSEFYELLWYLSCVCDVYLLLRKSGQDLPYIVKLYGIMRFITFYGRKKKMTEHWRRFIQPIMWRCKWVELKIKELQNQARMYDKEVEESRQAKKVELETLKSEQLGVKAQPPLPCYSQKNRVRERRKRKRVEKTSDVTSYALNHNLFSYQGMKQVF